MEEDGGRREGEHKIKDEECKEVRVAPVEYVCFDVKYLKYRLIKQYWHDVHLESVLLQIENVKHKATTSCEQSNNIFQQYYLASMMGSTTVAITRIPDRQRFVAGTHHNNQQYFTTNHYFD